MSEDATNSTGGLKPSMALRAPWVLVLALEVITRGWFEMLWMLVVADWVRKVRGKSTAFRWSIAYATFLPGLIVVAILIGTLNMILRITAEEILGLLTTVSFLYLFTVRTFALFTLRMELAEAPIGLRMGYWKTILFGTVYLQYCLRRFSRGMAAPAAGAGSNPFPGAPVDAFGTVEGSGSTAL